ncbi:MAG: outer membrane protein, partial [Stellaceae bacterium]
MRRPWLAAIAGAGLLVSAAAQAQTWNGPEIGVQGGYGWGTSSGITSDLTGATGPFPYSFTPSGGLGGAHAGYNWQWGPYVLGLEGDAEGGFISGSTTSVTGADAVRVHSNLYFDASLRGKFGYSFGRLLPYATGGVAFGNVTTSYNFDGAPLGSATGVRVGWTAGGGLNYALTPNWSLGAEYRYTDLGSRHSGVNGFVDSNSYNYNVVRAVLTYRFAPPPPPPPMATPAPMPAAAPAVVPQPPQTFLMFFDFDRYNLNEDARRVVEAAAANYKSTGNARIEVSGYT